MGQMNLSTKEKEMYRHGEWTCGYQGGGGREWDGVWEVGVSRHKLFHLEWIRTRSYCIVKGTIFNIL